MHLENLDTADCLYMVGTVNQKPAEDENASLSEMVVASFLYHIFASVLASVLGSSDWKGSEVPVVELLLGEYTRIYYLPCNQVPREGPVASIAVYTYNAKEKQKLEVDGNVVVVTVNLVAEAVAIQMLT